jgi:hypothetical protein
MCTVDTLRLEFQRSKVFHVASFPRSREDNFSRQICPLLEFHMNSKKEKKSDGDIKQSKASSLHADNAPSPSLQEPSAF